MNGVFGHKNYYSVTKFVNTQYPTRTRPDAAEIPKATSLRQRRPSQEGALVKPHMRIFPL